MKRLHIILLSVLAGLFSSCEDWLDVTSSSEIRVEDHYASVDGFQQTLLGCYIAMTHKDLYGENLTWHMVDMLGRQYDARKNAAADDYDLDRYNYQSVKSVPLIEKSWAKAYSVIVNANEALEYIDRNRLKLDSVNYRIIKGELLGVRAYLHFDLMRLFGCSHLAGRSDLSERVTVPYVTTVDKSVAPQLSYAETIRLLVQDLEEAVRLLEIDPICNRYPAEIYKEANIDHFYDYRQQHLNYYAVKTLLARVYMWEGSAASLSKAGALAGETIGELEKNPGSALSKKIVFTKSDVVPTTDMCLPEEHLFALNVVNLDQVIGRNLNREYSEEDRQYRALCIKNDVADELFEIKGVGISDCRYKLLYHNTGYWPEGTKTPSKLYQTTSTGATYLYRDLLPLMRLPELYYMAAECSLRQEKPDLERARTLIDKVRTARAIYEKLPASLDSRALMTEIEKEYRKEFICEGVLFYFFKRLGYEKLPRQEEVGVANSVDDKIYMLPYPEFEIQSGRVQ